MGYFCLACSRVRARTWATVVRRCGWFGGYEAADSADPSATKMRILPTERVVGRRSGMSSGLHITRQGFSKLRPARVLNSIRAESPTPQMAGQALNMEAPLLPKVW